MMSDGLRDYAHDQVRQHQRQKQRREKQHREKQERERIYDGEIVDDKDDEIIERLARMQPLDYERARKKEAERLGCRPAILDELVKAKRGSGAGNGADTKQGRPLVLLEPEPWPDPVDGVKLLEDLVAFFDEHARLPDRGSFMLSLWTVHTYRYGLWRYTPRLHITGPTKRCGKSRVLRLIQLLVCKPLPSSSITAPAVYRSVEVMHPTLLIDEADLSVRDKPELLQVLNGGYERDQFAVLTVGDDHEPRMFDLFAPVALAGIGRLAGTIEDRSIRLAMRRAPSTQKTRKITKKTEEVAERLRRQIMR